MAIVVETQKVVDRGRAGRIISGVEALYEEELPLEYMKGTPRCWKEEEEEGTILRVREEGYSVHRLVIGRWYSEDDFQKMLEKLRLCGTRLHEINLRVNQLKETWVGEETFVI